mmetsp:Transcript_43894/g.113395  ORF Transcript_43894/g.113395 Transcript_43894/m.113395 type:complete len:210 (+) Transcript_43894:140-769(+)
MTMKAIAAMETPNIFWCSLVSWSRTLLFESDSLSKCLSMLAPELAVLCTSSMSSCRTFSFWCLSSVSLLAALDNELSSSLIAANSSPSLCPVFLSSSALSSSKFFSMVEIRLPRFSMARVICSRMGCVSTTSLNTMFVRSLMASDSARRSLKLDASARTSTFSSCGTGFGGGGVVCTSSPLMALSWFSMTKDVSSNVLETWGWPVRLPP